MTTLGLAPLDPILRARDRAGPGAPLAWPTVAALVRDASRKYASNRAFSLLLPNGTTGHLTFAEVDALSDAFAVYLREVAGFRAGDRLAVQMPNCLAYPIVTFGALQGVAGHGEHQPALHRARDGAPVRRQRRHRAGGHRSLRRQGRAGAAQDGDPHGDRRDHRRPAAVADPHGRAHGAASREEAGAADHLCARHLRAARSPAGGSGVASGADPDVYLEGAGPDRVATLQYTGGTTGVSKGAVLSEGNLLANIAQCIEVWKPGVHRGPGDGDHRAAAVPHLRVHREPDGLLRLRRPQHPHPQSAAAQPTSPRRSPPRAPPG